MNDSDLKEPWPGTNFSPWELIRSDTAMRLGIDNTPESPEVWKNLEWLARSILQPIRERFGPIKVNSGYRCPELNDRVGGTDSSLHLAGQAADIEPLAREVDLLEVLEWAFHYTPFKELIAEYFPHGWVHIAGSRKFARTRERGSLKLKDSTRGYNMASVDELKAALGEDSAMA